MDAEEALMLGNTFRGEFSQPKKAKISENLKLSDNVPNVSPILHHTEPSIPSNENEGSEDSDEVDEADDCHAKTNLFGVNSMLLFETGTDGKDPMDQEEDD